MDPLRRSTPSSEGDAAGWTPWPHSRGRQPPRRCWLPPRAKRSCAPCVSPHARAQWSRKPARPGAAAMTPVEIRRDLVGALHLDLVGPEPGSPHAEEVLPQSPARWYLTGFLIPRETPAEERGDETSADEPDVVDEGGATDDAATPEP